MNRIHTDRHPVRPRTAPLILSVLAGLAFATFPAIRPWGDKTGVHAEMAQSFADPLWVGSHVSGMLGWGLLAGAAASTSGLHPATRWTLPVATATMLPYYGAETFALHALGGSQHLADDSVALLAAEIRADPVAITLFGIGLLLATAGAVRLAADTWRTGRVRWAGVPLAVLVATYLPQFFTSPEVRITHGILLGVACALWGAGRPSEITDAELAASDTVTGLQPRPRPDPAA